MAMCHGDCDNCSMAYWFIDELICFWDGKEDHLEEGEK